MALDVVTGLLPTLKPLRSPEFNVFDVMHHGKHENQLSNVFSWLLDPRGTHGLKSGFQRIFLDEVSLAIQPRDALPDGEFSVRQEVDTTPGGVGGDRADIVLESDSAVLVVENYFTSDPHGHSYEGYLAFGAMGGKRSVVVLLCAERNPALIGDEWRDAAVVDYPSLLTRLMAALDETYARHHPAAKTFLDHFHAKYVRGADVNDDELIQFVESMCVTGAAEKYGVKTVKQPRLPSPTISVSVRSTTSSPASSSCDE